MAVANAGLLGAPVAYSGYAPSAYAASPYAAGYASPAIVSQQNNILRTPGNLGQVSTYSKTINTPYSSVSKSDVRVSNDAIAYPGVAAYSAVASPLGYSAVAPRLASPLGYAAAPALAVAPRLASPLGYSAVAPRLASPLGYAAAPAIATSLGVSYSAAPVVSHISFDGIGAHFAY